MSALAACGATSPSVLGRCGRDAGHDGGHRSTGDTFEASWIDKAPKVPRLCEPQAEQLVDNPRALLDECICRPGCPAQLHLDRCPEENR